MRFGRLVGTEDTAADYNIISNLRFDEHHWAHPEKRPRPRDRVPKQRKVPAMLLKETCELVLGWIRVSDSLGAWQKHIKSMAKACQRPSFTW